MHARSTTKPFNRAARVALMATGLLVGLGANAHGQRAGGSIGVSLTVLQPVTTQPVRLVSFDIGRNGVATLQTTTPATSPVSQIVMASVVRESATSTAAERDGAVNAPMVASSALRYTVDLGASRAEATREPVHLRLRYLTVAGT